MELIYYLIIISALVGEYLLSTVSAVLNMNSITDEVPEEFKGVYDSEQYARSQAYLRARTRFGLVSGTFSLLLLLIVIHIGLFGFLDGFVRAQTTQPLLAGLLFFGIIFIIIDLIFLFTAPLLLKKNLTSTEPRRRLIS